MATLRERNLEKENAQLRALLTAQSRNVRQIALLATDAQAALTASATLMSHGTAGIGDTAAWTAQQAANATIAGRRTSR